MPLCSVHGVAYITLHGHTLKVVDEAHRLKNNASKSHKLVATLTTGFRVLLTGTVRSLLV
jgi:hypothetical protein